MLLSLSTLIVIILSFQVFPIALGVSAKDNLKTAILMVVILSISQPVFFFIGYYVGEQFMHLLANFKSIVLFAGFFIIGIRMIMEVLKIRKGERTYYLNNGKGMLLVAVAHSINTFLAGLLLFFVPTDIFLLTLILFGTTIIMSISGVMAKPGKLSFSFASFLYLIGGVFIIFLSVYFIFAAL